MQVPIQITVREMQQSDALEAQIEQLLLELTHVVLELRVGLAPDFFDLHFVLLAQVVGRRRTIFTLMGIL